jgi:hypothetical protein
MRSMQAEATDAGSMTRGGDDFVEDLVSGDSAPSIETSSVEAVDRIIRVWLEDSDVTVFCGVWSNGAVMELLPHGKAILTGPLYGGRFAGLRDLLLEDGAHHVHLDLGRLSRACYLVAPSVCYGFRPSFELRIAARGADPIHDFGLGLAVRQPYDRGRLRTATVARYFARVAQHVGIYPDVASLTFSRHTSPTGRPADWSAIEDVLASDPAIEHLRAFLPGAGAN